jgi:hypothetical protein
MDFSLAKAQHSWRQVGPRAPHLFNGGEDLGIPQPGGGAGRRSNAAARAGCFKCVDAPSLASTSSSHTKHIEQVGTAPRSLRPDTNGETAPRPRRSRMAIEPPSRRGAVRVRGVRARRRQPSCKVGRPLHAGLLQHAAPLATNQLRPVRPSSSSVNALPGAANPPGLESCPEPPRRGASK